MRSGVPDGRAYAKAVSWTFALAGALVWTGAATAAAPPPPPEDVPAVSAYVELVPTSRGSRSARRQATESRSLPSKIETQLAREGGSDAAALKKVATSPAYGAPPPVRKRTRPQPEPADESPLGAAVTVVSDGSDDRLLALGIVLIALTGAAAGAAYLRRPAR